jgi:hypothetical protein
MSTLRPLRLGLLALSTAGLAAACGEPFALVGTGGSSTASSGTGGSGTTSSGSTGGNATTSTGATSSSSSSTSSGSCDATDPDGDGVSECQGDCDNNDPTVHPGAPEICGDMKDNGCTGQAEQGCQGLGTFVSGLTGDDNNPGTQAAPVKTIAKGIEHAKTIGNGVAVYVAGGGGVHYPDPLTVTEGISLYGGYNRMTWVRELTNSDTPILAQGPDGVYIPPGITRKTVIDGFRIQGKNDAANTAQQPYGAALTIDRASPTISNNVINGPTEPSGNRSIAVIILGPTSTPKGPLITNNRITGGNASSSACEVSIGLSIATTTWPPTAPGAAAEITSNQIRAGSCKNSYALSSYAHADQTLIFDNDISTGAAGTGDAWGILVGANPLDAEMLIDRNRINVDQNIAVGCNLLSASAFAWCGGIQSESAKARITNNIVFGVKAVRSAAVWLNSPEVAPQSLVLNGNYLDGAGSTAALTQSTAVALTLGGQGTNGTVGRIRNNILAGGVAPTKFGIFEDSPNGKTLHPEKLENNDFFLTIAGGNAYYRFWDGSAATKHTAMDTVNMLPGSQANFAGDPGLDSTFHLTSFTSICVDKGTSSEAPAKDFDGETRPKGQGIDVGPDEK